MKDRLIWPVYWALVVVFIVVMGIFFIGRELLLGIFPIFLIASGITLILLGAALIYLTLKKKMRGSLKKFLLLMGASAAGIPISVVLHNVIYGLFIHFFGANFWDRVGLSDEPVFFFMAVFICPIAFLVGAIGSIVCSVKIQSGR